MSVGLKLDKRSMLVRRTEVGGSARKSLPGRSAIVEAFYASTNSASRATCTRICVGWSQGHHGTLCLTASR